MFCQSKGCRTSCSGNFTERQAARKTVKLSMLQYLKPHNCLFAMEMALDLNKFSLCSFSRFTGHSKATVISLLVF